MTFDLAKIVRPKIYSLEAYRCARDDFKEGILLDANENAHGPTLKVLDESLSQLHRYPDPNQVEFKEKITALRNSNSAYKSENLDPLTSENVCLGVGSDESIDALIRACCVPGKEKILIMPPTYGMYTNCADINDVDYVKVPLVVEDNSFQMDTPAVLEALRNDPAIKLIFITSPGNPTGALINSKSIETVASQWQSGIVVVDEAYIDFSISGGSAAPLVNKYPNVAVCQTLSKSFGLAGVRLGMTFASKPLSRVLNAMKAPYNISSLTSQVMLKAMEPDSIERMKSTVKEIIEQRARVLKELTSLENVENNHVGGLDANFIMVRILDGDKPSNEVAKKLYYKLASESKVVTRFRGTEYGCTGCLRITIGTKEENDVLIEEFAKTLRELQV
ncbi:LANO_0H07382g1_1 [Lachancea nothofagi CBS 11611]|uniref:histidinol-phosphate transaminase n=1 Tax=Lachancea nothofagi CBS 11611 TaxID=1266666 RepID=A0A1G4KLS3_9SACH|nr:LANO_0H07382g1_1 [Lachancea nothofagi CBS 11611]